jgi:hypothetical protein
MPIVARHPDMQPPFARRPLGVTMATLALALIMGACGASSSASLRPPTSESTSKTPATSESPEASPETPSARVVPSPRPSPQADWPAPTLDTSLAWHRVGTIKAYDIDGVVGFGGGYVAVSRFGGAWFSQDGADWRSVTLPKPLGGPIDVAATASRVIIVGGAVDPGCDSGGDTGGHCPGTPVSWWSDDGVKWHASNRTNDVDAIDYDEFTSVWAAPGGGWDAAVTTWAGAVTIGAGVWHTDSGTDWEPLDPAPPDIEEESVHGGTASLGGDRLVWRGIADPQVNEWVTIVSASPTGRDWRSTPFPGERVTVMAAVPADAGTGHPWVLVGADGEDLPTIWVSDDLGEWTSFVMPTNPGFQGRVDDIVATSSGDVAVAQQFDGETGNHEAWISSDGRRWDVLPRIGIRGKDYGPGRVAWGPAGVLGFGVMPASESTSVVVVWELR